MLWRREKGSAGAPQSSFFLTQPSSPDVYGLYKLSRARECPSLWSSSAEAQTYHFPFPSFSLSLLPRCKSIQTHKQQRQLGNRATTILQRHSIMATENYFHSALQKKKEKLPDLDFSSSCSESVSPSQIPTEQLQRLLHVTSPPRFIAVFWTTLGRRFLPSSLLLSFCLPLSPPACLSFPVAGHR